MTDPPVTPDPLTPPLWQAIYEAAANEGSILHDETVFAIERAMEARLRALQAERDVWKQTYLNTLGMYEAMKEIEVELRAEVARLQGANANVTRELRAMQVEMHRTAPKAGA